MSAEKDQIKAGVSSALDDYAQYDSNGQPVTAERGKKVLNVELATGTAVIGTVAIDQTTPGTTNGVQVNAALPTGTNNIGDVDVLSVIPGAGATNLGKAEDAVHASGDVGVMALGVANEAAATFAADGDYVPIATDTQGAPYVNLKAGSATVGKVGIDQTTPGTTNFVQNKEMPDATSTFAITPYASAAAEASAVVKASAGNLYGFVFTNGNAAIRYVQVFNASALPGDGAVPALSFPVAGGGVLPFDTGNFPNYFSNGIVICNSTTQMTKTIGAADSLFYVQKH